MSIRPSFTTGLGERTSTADSLLGSLAGSLNLPVEDGAAALVWTSREALQAQMVSKWPTLAFQIRRAGALTNPLARDGRAIAFTADDPLPFPSNLVMARAAMIRATEGTIQDALVLLDVYGERTPEGYPRDREGRIDALRPYWGGISPAIAEHLEDFARVEAALARLISIDRIRLRFDLHLGKSTVRDLVLGKMDWLPQAQVWLSQRMAEQADNLRRFLAREEAFVVDAGPALVGLAWQLFPDLQPFIEQHARWIQPTPDGDPRTSWREGWDGYDETLNPEGYDQ